MKPALDKLPKHVLVEVHRRAFGAVGDSARTSKDHYLKALDACAADTLAEILATIEHKPRKPQKRMIEKRNAIASAREFRAIAMSLVDWGDDLASNPEAIRKLQARARAALE
jgi:hypothetical protein